MRAIAPLLLLISLGISFSGSTTSDTQDVASRVFFGKLVTASLAGDYGATFDLLFSKWDKFFPGCYNADQSKEIREFFIAYWSKKSPELNNSLKQRINSYIEERLVNLDEEARTFILETCGSLKNVEPKLRAFAPDITTFRSKFDALTEPVKTSLAKEFPILAHLDEFHSLVKVFDDIIIHVQGLCKNLPGVKYCEEW